MDQADRPEVPGDEHLQVAKNRIWSRLSYGFLSVASWCLALWEAYGHTPRTRTFFDDFAIRIDPLSKLMLERVSVALPVLATLGLIWVWRTDSRWARRFFFVGLPFVTGIALLLINALYVTSAVGLLTQ
jgi:hypothetical protein